MKNYTNINIIDIDSSYKYILEYEPTSSFVQNEKIGWSFSEKSQTIEILDEYINAVRNENEWHKVVYNELIVNKDYLPTNENNEIEYKSANIRLYFPKFSVDTYKNDVKYALSIYTWVHGKKISLGNYIIDRLNALACAPKKFLGDEYHEYVDFSIIDPWELSYSDSWKDFRSNVCGEPSDINALGSILYFTLYPVEFAEDSYIMMDEFQGGQNSINISLNDNDYFNLHIQPDLNNPINNGEEWYPGIHCSLKFNSAYESIRDYLSETYNIKGRIIGEYEMVVKDKDDCYMIIRSKRAIINNLNEYTFTKKDFEGTDSEIINILGTNIFNSWDNYKDGLSIICSLSILNSANEEILYLKSNELPLSQELFSYFVGDRPINYINLNEIEDMKLYNINVVNKTVNKIIQIDRPSDSKSNIIQPIFFKARDVSDIIVHPAVTEYISINLDAFKSKVNTFMIQIEGCSFPESGRTSSGIIFKIVGSKLPNKVKQGIYYVLNQDSELVTNGKYRYDL